MRAFQFVLAAALAIAVSTAAAAQTPPTQTTPEPVAANSHWLASGFVGSDFGADADEAAVSFGGTIGYLWRGILGPEFQANWSPDFDLEGSRSALVLGTEPFISSYMVNAIGAVPLGLDGQWQPYVSGGLGALALRSDALVTGGERNEFEPDATRWGGNLGVGLMGFMGAVGFRGDVRYFRGFEENEIDPDLEPGEIVGRQILSDLAFWRANIGVAFRW